MFENKYFKSTKSQFQNKFKPFQTFEILKKEIKLLSLLWFNYYLYNSILKNPMQNTALQFSEVISQCRDLFSKKLQDYGAAWRVLRPSSITDQIYIKVNRIRTLQMTDVKMVDEHEEDEFIAIVNYSIIGLIQLEKGFSENLDEDRTEILKLYDDYAQKAKDLMLRKNHDYGEAWREMRISSITDLIYQKVLRTKQIEDNQGKTLVSEGLDANYYDMLNYAVFCLIKMMEEKI